MENKKKAIIIVGISIALFAFVAILSLNKIVKNENVVKNNTVPTNKLIIDDFNNNKLDDAIKLSEEELKKNKENIDIMLLLANSYAQKGSLEFKEEEYGKKSLNMTNQILNIESENANAYEIAGYAYEIMGNHGEAIKNYNKAIELDGKESSVYTHRGHNYFLISDMENAIKNVDMALEINPNDTYALITKSKYIIDFFEDDLIDAEQMLNKVIASNDRNTNLRLKAEAYQLLGKTKAIQSDFEEAMQMYKEAVSIDETLSSAWSGLAEVTYFSMQDSLDDENEFNSKFEESLTYVQKAINIYDNNSVAYVIMAKIMHLNKENDDSVKQILQIAKDAAEVDISLSIGQREDIKNEIEDLKIQWGL